MEIGKYKKYSENGKKLLGNINREGGVTRAFFKHNGMKAEIFNYLQGNL